MSTTTYYRALKNTGVYVAKLIEIQAENDRALVEIVSVLKHPRQGDLHHPRKLNVPYFHPRKALAKHEKTWVPLVTLKEYKGEVLPYETSLQKAYKEKMDKLKEDGSDWAKASIQRLKEYEKEYGLS